MTILIQAEELTNVLSCKAQYLEKGVDNNCLTYTFKNLKINDVEVDVKYVFHNTTMASDNNGIFITSRFTLMLTHIKTDISQVMSSISLDKQHEQDLKDLTKTLERRLCDCIELHKEVLNSVFLELKEL